MSTACSACETSPSGHFEDDPVYVILNPLSDINAVFATQMTSDNKCRKPQSLLVKSYQPVLCPACTLCSEPSVSTATVPYPRDRVMSVVSPYFWIVTRPTSGGIQRQQGFIHWSCCSRCRVLGVKLCLTCLWVCTACCRVRRNGRYPEPDPSTRTRSARRSRGEMDVFFLPKLLRS